ncbi:hypothetical protein BDN70DRAFT_923221 [Pholiota conissans]|uniref:F-box domain-containing protein n=1 Tax=Pholiota conissans TaxID=109636 RepID=A0A9P5YWR5_9AGAR|nr:hypothetical protein BDN70DRAFT_923221 [Pholiota conissans]
MSSDPTSQPCDHLPDGTSLCDPTNPNACVPCRNIFKIENSLRALRDAIVSLETQRRNLQTQIIQKHNPPIHRIPPEIAGEVFKWCIPDDIFDLDFRATRSTHTFCSPLVISAVCRKWRDWAYSMPRLWNILPFYTAGLPVMPLELPNPIVVKKWIERAGQLPLSVTLHDPHDTPNDDLVLQVINALNQYSSRWQTLRFSGRPEIFSHLSNQIQNLPKIQGLYFECGSDFSIAGAEDDDGEFSSVDFPWERLTRLELRNAIVFSFFAFLRAAPNVIKFSFKLYNDCILGDTHFGPSTPIIHFHLREIVDSTYWGDMKYLDYIQCPSLESLITDEYQDSCLDSSILPFLQRSQCTLKILSLQLSSYPSASEMTLLCEEIPTLQTLNFTFEDLMPESVIKTFFLHLGEFSTISGRQVLRYLPNLRSLSLRVLENFSDWKILPDIFGYPTGQNPANYRPNLELIDIFSEWADALPLDCIDSMDKDTLTRFLWLEESGVKWKCYSYVGGKEELNNLRIGIVINVPLFFPQFKGPLSVSIAGNKPEEQSPGYVGLYTDSRPILCLKQTAAKTLQIICRNISEHLPIRRSHLLPQKPPILIIKAYVGIDEPITSNVHFNVSEMQDSFEKQQILHAPWHL